MKLSCSLPPGPDIVEKARLLEDLGYERLWLYDSPLLYSDVWVALARIAEATRTLEIGPGVLVPELRHVATTAAAIATVESIAPGRLVVSIGTGFTARRLLGRPPLSWKRVESWIRELRGLLAGETVEIEGRPVRMMHPDGYAPARPIRTPILVAASGPRGQAVARELGDGVMTLGDPMADGGEWAVVRSGTVLDAGERFDSPRVFDAIATSIALIYHSIYEAQGDAVDALPGGRAWREAIEAFPPEQRHLVVHEGHCVFVPERERALLDPEVGAMTLSGPPDALAERVRALVDAGMTELVYSPAGPDVPRELRAMAKVVRESV